MKILEKILNVRSNNTVSTDICKEDFFNLMTEFIKLNSKLFNNSLFVRGNVGENFFFDIENSSNIISLIGNENLKPPIKISKSIMSTPKGLGTEIKVSKYFQNKFNKDIEITEEEEKYYLTSMVYKPFMKSIEKCLIGGTYFDKPLFSTTNQLTGTNDFNGLLKLVRKLKDTNDNNLIVGNSSTISNIIGTITKESYLNEYLLNGTIERIPVISTVDSPVSENGNILVGFDPEKICLLLTDNLQCKKFSVLEDSLNSYYHFFCFVNGGDIFDNSIGLTV